MYQNAVFDTSNVSAHVDGPCRQESNEAPTLAWGLRRLYDNVLHKDYAPLKTEITLLLRGHSNYYRYNSGELKLTPSLQRKIAQIMAARGYTTPPPFEHYCKEDAGD